MKLWVLVFINALAVALSLSIVNFYFQQKWVDSLITFSVTLITSYAVFYYLIERFVYSKIKLIYKLIHNLKLGKDLKDALGEYMSADPINDVEHEVKEWARDKKSEIDRLKEQEKFRREFLSNISHELKTPLAGLKTQAQIAAIAPDEATRRSALDRLARGIARTDRMVRQLLDMAMVEQENTTEPQPPISFAVVIAEVLEDMTSLAVQRSVRLVPVMPNDTPVLIQHHFMIAAALRNLVANAVQASPDGEEVQIVVRRDPAEGWLCAISDRGAGIAPNEREKVTDRFYRGRGNANAGSGLGLSIVSVAMDRIGGALRLSTRDGGGEIALLVLPFSAFAPEVR